MEKRKKWYLTTESLIKWLVLLATVLSSYFAANYRSINNKDKIEMLERKIETLESKMSEVGQQSAAANGKLDVILNYVESINTRVDNLATTRSNERR